MPVVRGRMDAQHDESEQKDGRGAKSNDTTGLSPKSRDTGACPHFRRGYGANLVSNTPFVHACLLLASWGFAGAEKKSGNKRVPAPVKVCIVVGRPYSRWTRD